MESRKTIAAAAAIVIALSPAFAIAGNGGGTDEYEPEAGIEGEDTINGATAPQDDDGALAEDEPGAGMDREDGTTGDGFAEDEPGTGDTAPQMTEEPETTEEPGTTEQNGTQ